MIQKLNLFVRNKEILLKESIGIILYQALQLLASAAIGFLIVRLLSKSDYALFSLFNMTIAFILGVGSISSASTFIPFANKLGLYKSSLTDISIIFMKLSKYIAYIGFFLGLALCLITALNNNWINFGFITVLPIALLCARNQYFSRFYHNYFKMEGSPLFVFKASLIGDIIRLILIGGIILLPSGLFNNYYIILLFLVLFVSTITRNKFLSKYSGFKLSQKPVLKTRHKLVFWKLLRPMLFPSFFFQIMQQFRVVLIFFIAGTSVIAESIALGRLMMLFLIFDKVVEMSIIPRLSRVKEKSVYLKNILNLSSFIVILGVILLISAIYFPNEWLWLLGSKYSNIQIALLWAISTAIVERVSGFFYFSQLSKGLSIGQWWVPILATCTYFLVIFLNGVESAEDVTIALFITACVNLLAQISIFIYIYINPKIFSFE